MSFFANSPNLILFVNSTDHNVSKRDQCLFENRLLIELLLYSKLDKLLTKKILHITVILLITQRGKYSWAFHPTFHKKHLT